MTEGVWLWNLKISLIATNPFRSYSWNVTLKMYSELIFFMCFKVTCFGKIMTFSWKFEACLQFRKQHHCVKSVQRRSFFWSVFSYIRTEYLRIQSEYKKIRTRKNSVFGHFLCSASLIYVSLRTNQAYKNLKMVSKNYNTKMSYHIHH